MILTNTFLCLDPVEWTALFTGLLFVATILLWFANYINISDSRKVFVALNSPYIGFEGAALKLDEKENKAYLEVHFRNYGKIPANNVRVFIRWGGKLEEVKQGALTGILPATTAFPDVLMFQSADMETKDKPGSGRYDYDTVVVYKKDLFIRGEVRYMNLDNQDYIHYYLGMYVHQENNFVLESYAGPIEECPYKID